MSTELHQRVMTYDYKNEKTTELMRFVWQGFPWMVDAFTGSMMSDRDHEMREWLEKQLGQEASPTHGIEGRWQRGGATIYGWTWIGFVEEADMLAFQEQWQDPTHQSEEGTS